MTLDSEARGGGDDGRSRCPGCDVELPVSGGPTHPYIGASAGCWERYGLVLERAYADPERREVLQLAVDAYACQHPGVPERRSAQSVGIHLMTLFMVLEQGADPRDGPKLHKRMVARPEVFTWLTPPQDRGRRTVLDVLDTDAYAAAVTAWAEDVWAAWATHHDTVRAWISSSLTPAEN